MRLLRATIASIGAALVASSLVALVPGAAAAPSDPTCPGPSLPLPSPASGPLTSSTAIGRATLEQLGSRLAEAARLNGLSAAALSSILSSDPGARLDRCGRLAYLEQRAASSERAAVPSGLATVARAPLSTDGDAFALESRPGASKTIYLDFDGAALTNTAWNVEGLLRLPNGSQPPNGYRLLPYDSDGNPAGFSTAELDAIKQIWLRVAEDYAPFAVNVTTRDPGLDALDRSSSADLQYGSTAVITADADLMNYCTCGGYAFLAVFDEVAPEHMYRQPALVFSEGLANGDPKVVAEAASHEVGHNLRLLHAGVGIGGFTTQEYYQGQGAWAPIMGASYDRPLTQWSKGEYSNATNRVDQTAIIASQIPYIADEPTDTPLVPGATVDALITSAADSDGFTFTSTGGPVTVTVTPQSVGGNLDTRLDLYTSLGQLVGSDNPPVPVPYLSSNETTGLGSSLAYGSLPAGPYRAVVSGTGQGPVLTTGYSSYGSLGRYTVSVSYDPPGAPSVTTASLPEGTAGTAYSAQLTSADGVAPMTWSLAAGALPAGLTLSTTGRISGTPTLAGSPTFSVRVTDALSRSATAPLSLTIRPRLAVSTSRLPAATVGRSYAAALGASGGLGPYTWARVSGSLPAGLSLSSAGRITGVPSSTVAATFAVRVRDYAGRTATRSYTLTPARPLLVTTAARLPAATRGASYSVTLTASGGSGTRRWARTAGSLPPGLLLSASGTISGRPLTRGAWSATIRVVDSAGRASSRLFYLTVR